MDLLIYYQCDWYVKVPLQQHLPLGACGFDGRGVPCRRV
jgi:hypothetical protein